MHTCCYGPRLPYARVDAIDDHTTALAFLVAIVDRSARSTVAIMLDEFRRGLTIIHVAETSHPDNDTILSTADEVIRRSGEHPGFRSVIMASVRPGGRDELDDLDRWSELDGRFEAASIDLVEWFVLTNSISTPRALIGEPQRWRS